MCEITTALALSAATTALSGAGQAYSQHQAQKRLEDRAESTADQMVAQSVSKDFERTRKAAQERARIQALAGVGGGQAQSIEAQLSDSAFQRSYDSAGINYNLGRNIQDLGYQTQQRAQQIGSPMNTMLQTGLNIGSMVAQSELSKED